MSELTVALDVGGTKIATALVDSAGRPVHRLVAPTPAGDADEIWAVVAGAVRAMLTAAAGADVVGVGIASAGPIDVTTGTVSPINIPGWLHFPLVEAVTGLTGLPVRLAGDAVCVALGEFAHGAGRGARFMLGMVVSSGIGGGLVLDGEPYAGRTGNAGHVGHVVVDTGGVRCSCGGHGCVETVAAGPHLVRWARDQGWPAPVNAGAVELAAAARAGDVVARRAFRRGARGLAAMIASVAAVCDVDLVVVGGGVAAAGELLFAPLRAALSEFAGLAYLSGLRVEPAQLGADAGLVGAAALF